MAGMRRVALATLVMLTSLPAMADTFGGFSGVDRHYLVNQDKVCAPLPVSTTTGPASCEKAPTDVIAKLSIKDPLPQRGPKAEFTAAASGRTLTISRGARGGAPNIVWNAPDPIGKVVEVFASQYADRVAVTYTTRRLGKEVTDVIAFDFGGKAQPDATPTPTTTPTPPPSTGPVVVEDARVKTAVAAAKKAPKAKAAAAWQAVLAIDAQHSEALYSLAMIHADAKKTNDALAQLGTLASSSRPDAIEYLVEARYAKSFAALRSVDAFRKNVGLDRPAATPYERLMGFGGQWEQTGTSCDKPEVRFTATRDRVIKLRVKSTCSGAGYDMPFKGTWRLDGDTVVLTFPTKGKQATADDESLCVFERAGDEDALRCSVGKDIEFTILPTRR